MIVTHNGRVYRKSVGMSVPKDGWLKSKQRPKDVFKNARLDEIAEKLKKAAGLDPNENTLKAAIEYAVAPPVGTDAIPPAKNKAGRPSFWEYFREWGERPSPVQRQRRLYPNIVSRLMGEREDWEDIDEAYYYRLCRAMDNYGYSINTKGAVISKLKLVMSEGYKQKFHKNEEFRQFRRMSEVPETIALTETELDDLWHFTTKSSMEQKARDLFIIGTYAAARWEDYSRLSIDNISNGRLNYEQLKTGRTVIIPASSRLVECLVRNGGHAPEISQQKFNDAIKVVCRKLGMTAKVHVSESKGAGRVSKTYERWEMVSSHTARRTGATLLYLSGVPIKQCMMITGHTTEKNFLRYIRIAKEENADLLAAYPFFK